MTTKLACVKCGGEGIHIRWERETGEYAYSCLYSDTVKTSKEHLHYHCRACQYDWIGPTKDSKEAEGKP